MLAWLRNLSICALVARGAKRMNSSTAGQIFKFVTLGLLVFGSPPLLPVGGPEVQPGDFLLRFVVCHHSFFP